jgi:hypothetical protein
MESIVEKEFEKLKLHINKPIELVVTTCCEEELYWALLQEVYPYNALELKLGDFKDGIFTWEIGETCPFIGAISGISLVRNQNGNVLYQNKHLRFEKDFYNPFQDKGDNAFINSMRSKKFGSGHDYEMLD